MSDSRQVTRSVCLRRNGLRYAVVIEDMGYEDATQLLAQLAGQPKTILGDIVPPPPNVMNIPAAFDRRWRETRRWLLRGGHDGLTILEGPIGVNEIVELMVYAAGQASLPEDHSIKETP